MAERTLPALTGQEMAVLKLLPYGLTYSQIGKRLFIAENTVKTYIRKINRKWGTSNSIQVLMCAFENGVLTLKVDFDEQTAALDEYRTTVFEVARLLGIAEVKQGLTRQRITAELRTRLGLTDPAATGGGHRG